MEKRGSVLDGDAGHVVWRWTLQSNGSFPSRFWTEFLPAYLLPSTKRRVQAIERRLRTATQRSGMRGVRPDRVRERPQF